MTNLEQRFLESVPNELRKLNDTLTKMHMLLNTKRGECILQDSLLMDSSITESSSAAELLQEELSCLDHEEFWVVYLGSDLRPYRKQMICSGNLTSSIIDHRRVVKEALNSNASAVLVYHNHPSNNLKPSQADIESTEQLRNALKLFDVSLVDHLILGRSEYYSFADEEIRRYKNSQ